LLQVPHYCRSFAKSAGGLSQSSMSSRLTAAADDVERGGGPRCLLEATNRYHSEPDLVDAVAASLDDRPTSHDRPRPSKRPQSVTVHRSAVAQAPSSPTSRAAVGIGFQSPYPSHTHSETCGNSHTHRSPKSHSSPFSLLIFGLNLLSFHVCFVCFLLS